MSKDIWLKLHTSILTSRKFISLPHNDHRQAFFVLLLLAKKGLESAPESYLLGHLNLSKRRWKNVRKDLIDCGLLDGNGLVNGFEESQLTAAAFRMRKLRKRNSDVTSDEQVTPNVTTECRVQNVECINPKEKSSTSPEVKPALIQDLPEALDLVRLLGQLMVDNDPGARLPQTEKQKATWVRDMGRINRIDGRDWLEIGVVINWCQADEFWMGNILSPGKLRKQFSKLVLAMNRGYGGGRPGPDTRVETNRQALAETLEEIEYENGSKRISGGSGDI